MEVKGEQYKIGTLRKQCTAAFWHELSSVHFFFFLRVDKMHSATAQKVTKLGTQSNKVAAA